MVNHKRVYLKYFGYGEQDFIPCEVCAGRCVDIHHLVFKSLGGKDEIENLMALCRTCHEIAHDSRLYNEQLKKQHLKFIKR